MAAPAVARGPVSQRYAQIWRLCAADELAVLAGRLKAMMAMGASVVGRKERANDELTVADRLHFAADFFDEPQYSCPIGWGVPSPWRPR